MRSDSPIQAAGGRIEAALDHRMPVERVRLLPALPEYRHERRLAGLLCRPSDKDGGIRLTGLVSDQDQKLPTFKERVLLRASETQFDVEHDDFSSLEIREAERFHYFYDRDRKRLIKNFVLRVGPRVDTMCNCHPHQEGG